MFLTCGEAVIDMIPDRAQDSATVWRPVTGGAAVNTAIALARLGKRVGFFGGLGTDTFAEQLARSLRDEGVDIALTPRLDAPTTLVFVHLTDGNPRFSFYDHESSVRQLSPLYLPDLKGINALVFGGFCLVHGPAAGTFEALMQMAGPERLTYLDPNIRPALIGELEADYRARLARMQALADVIKFSDEDIAWLQPDPPEQLLSGRAVVVIHSHGAAGATVYSRHGAIRVPAPQVTVVDTVGAGDTFNAGFLFALDRSGLLSPAALAQAGPEQLADAATFAIRAASDSVTRIGANPPFLKDLS